MDQKQTPTTVLKITWASVGGNAPKIAYATKDFLLHRHVGVSFTEEVELTSIPIEWQEKIMKQPQPTTESDQPSMQRNTSANAWIKSFSLSFDSLIKSSHNILIDNVNFRTGYYFKNHPETANFVSKVLKEQATILLDKVLDIQEEIKEEFLFDKLPVPNAIQAEFSAVLNYIDMTFINNEKFNWNSPDGIFYKHKVTEQFVTEIQSKWAENLKNLLLSLKNNSLHELKKLNVEASNKSDSENLIASENRSVFSEYVLMLVLSGDNKNILTIKKDRGPAHLINKVTFPGGHIEDCDRTVTFDQVPYLAATREIKEETNLDIPHDKWKSIGVQWGDNYCLHVLATRYDGDIFSAKTMESEVVSVLDVANSLREFDQELASTDKKYTNDFGVFLRRALNACQPYRRPSM